MPTTGTTVGADTGAAERRDVTQVSPGDVVSGRYVVEEVLGSGGMGVVVAARHEALGHRVALKFVSATACSDAEAYARFTREAKIIAKLESEHVVRVVDFGIHQGVPYMAMDLLSGRDLGSELQMRGTMPVEEVADYVIQACDGLAAAHAHGVVHRDVKAANLFLAMRADGERVVKVLDFGVSKLQEDPSEDVDLTHTRSMLGSPLYMSPEQIRDPRSVDGRADVWSLGVVLHKLLTGMAPFAGQTTNALCASIAADAPRRLREDAEHLPERLEAIVLRCLQKRPNDRYANVATLARDLAPFGSERGRAIAERLVARAAADGELEEPEAAPPPARRRVGTRVLFLAVAMGLAAAVAVVAWVEIRPRWSQRSTPSSGAPVTTVPAVAERASATPTATATASVVASAVAATPPASARRAAPPLRPLSRPPAGAGRLPATAATPAATAGFGGSALDDHR
jgi:serine/threonine-protein kinase